MNFWGLLLVLRPLLGAVDAGNPPGPADWTLSMKLTDDARHELIRSWSAPSKTQGAEPLTEAEANALLDDPRAQLIYGERTVEIVAPSMVSRQRQEHEDLLQMFLLPENLDLGLKFYEAHRPALEAVKKRRGVDPSVVVSILMWESKLGEQTGKYTVFNVFTSQAYFLDDANRVALEHPDESGQLDPKAQKARVERIHDRALRNLRVLVQTCKARGMDPLAVRGSWAGALGYPQFMPASLKWAEDGDGDGKIDLYSFDDSIASIARYLGEHGFTKSRERAVLAYNHEGGYVRGVLAWADALTRALAEGHKAGPPPP
jgi:membrane-bound lytic murein transglycosylase B